MYVPSLFVYRENEIRGARLTKFMHLGSLATPALITGYGVLMIASFEKVILSLVGGS